MKSTKKVQTTGYRIPRILERMSAGIQLGKSEIRILLRAGYEVPDTQEKKISALESTMSSSIQFTIPVMLKALREGSQLTRSEITILLRAGYKIPDTQEEKISAMEDLLGSAELDRIPRMFEAMEAGIQLHKSEIILLLSKWIEVPNTQEEKLPALESLLESSMVKIEALQNELRNKEKSSHE